MSTSDPVPAPPLRRVRAALAVAWPALLVWALSVPAAEAAYRIAGTPVAATLSGIYEPFDVTGYRLRPRVAVLQDWVSGRFWVHTDDRAFRVAAGDPPAGADPDVLVLGDSQAFGQGLDFEPSLVGAMREAARADGFDVANAAVGGHSLRDQAKLAGWLLREGRVRPRALLLCLTARALAYPDAEAAVVVVDGDLWDEPPTLASRGRKLLSRNSAVYVTVRNALRRGGEATHASDVLTLYATGPVQDARIGPLTATIGGLRDACRAAGADLVLAYLPLAIEPRIDEMARAAGVAAASGGPLATARRVADATGLPILDCGPALAAVRARGEPVTLQGDSHYGAAASLEAGRLLWRAHDWRNALRR